jgi:hypothetical protein
MPPNELQCEYKLDMLDCFRLNASVMYFELSTEELLNVQGVNREAGALLKEVLPPVVKEMWERRYRLWERVIRLNMFFKCTLTSDRVQLPIDSITKKCRWTRCCYEWPECIHNPVITGCNMRETKDDDSCTTLVFRKPELYPDDGLGYTEGVRAGKVFKVLRIAQCYMKHEPRLWVNMSIRWVPTMRRKMRVQERKLGFLLSNTGLYFTRGHRESSVWPDPDVFVRTTWEDFVSLFNKFIDNPWEFDTLGPDFRTAGAHG